jgi:hypothetical protein
MIHSTPYRNPCRLYIHLTLTYSVGPSNVVGSSELEPAPPFPPMRVLEVQPSRALSLVWEVALKMLRSDCEEQINEGVVIIHPPLLNKEEERVN